MAIRQQPRQGSARIAVAVLDVAAPNLFSRLIRFAGSYHHGAHPTLITVIIGNQSTVALFKPAETREALFSFNQFSRCGIEGRFQDRHAIAILGLLLGITVVKRFDPNQCRRLNGMPTIIARTCLHTINWHLILQRQTRQLVDEFSLCIPDLNLFRKCKVRIEIRKRSMNARHQDVLAVRRGVNKIKNRRLSNVSDFTAH